MAGKKTKQEAALEKAFKLKFQTTTIRTARAEQKAKAAKAGGR